MPGPEAILAEAARTALPILITAASARRRSDLARDIHDQSDWQGRPLVTLSCDVDNANSRLAIRAALQRADGGSIFLDAIDRMSNEAQAELYSFLTNDSLQRVGRRASAPPSVRVITGTDRLLLPLIRSGAFDHRLFYRLNIIHVIAETDPPAQVRES